MILLNFRLILKGLFLNVFSFNYSFISFFIFIRRLSEFLYIFFLTFKILYTSLISFIIDLIEKSYYLILLYSNFLD